MSTTSEDYETPLRGGEPLTHGDTIVESCRVANASTQLTPSLNELTVEGLPLDRPDQLLERIDEHQLRVMTANKKQGIAAHDETLGETGRSAFDFHEQMNYDPINTLAEILNGNPDNSLFDFGVNIINVEDITNFDHSLVLATGPQTKYRFARDTHTAHQVQLDDGAINSEAVANCQHVQLRPAEHGANLSGQMTQTEYDADSNKTQDVDTSDFLTATTFEDSLAHNLD